MVGSYFLKQKHQTSFRTLARLQLFWYIKLMTSRKDDCVLSVALLEILSLLYGIWNVL